MPAMVETMFYVRETPWHGLGVRIEEAPNSREALIVAGLDWEVEQHPIYVNGKHVKGYVANVRSDNGEVLGIVTPKYKIVQNRDAFAFTDELVAKGNTKYETAGSLMDGKHVWLLARMQDSMHLVGDEVEPYLCFSNTHDGTGSVKVFLTPVRVVCQNTLNLALKTADRSWSVRHLGDMMAKLEEARNTLEMYHEYKEAIEKEAQILATTKVSDSTVDKLIEYLFPIPEDISDRKLNNIEEDRSFFRACLRADDIADFRGTAWGVINAVSDFATHKEAKRLTATYKERRMLQVISGDTIFDKAYDFLKKVA